MLRFARRQNNTNLKASTLSIPEGETVQRIVDYESLEIRMQKHKLKYGFVDFTAVR